MQGLHHQQQQLAALLAAALPKEDPPPPPSSSPSSAAAGAASLSPSRSSSSASDDDSARVSAIKSLQRAILHPHNALVVSRSASFLAQGLFQLLSDKSYAVRQSAVITYGSLSSLSCSNQLASNGRQTSIMFGGLADRLISWALPKMRAGLIDNREAELALDGLREFLNIGDAGGTERYVLAILKSCQELLEDERTSSNLLRKLLDILTIISVKFSISFQPHFIDIVDLLLGWALLPDLLESDRHIILDSFLQFKKHWLGNLQFSLGLISKFLGDMEAVLQDRTLGAPQQFSRLLPLLSCFLTVLQITASGLREMNMFDQMTVMLVEMLPRLLACLLTFGTKFGWSKWMKECQSCLNLFADLLREKFATFYAMAFDVLFQNQTAPSVAFCSMTPSQVSEILKTNLQLLSQQRLSLLPSSVQRILKFHSPISFLRLHPNCTVTGVVAVTYLFLLQHDCDGVASQAIDSLMQELELLKSLLANYCEAGNFENNCPGGMDGEFSKDLNLSCSFSKYELLALIKFDLKLLLSCVCLDNKEGTVGWVETLISKCNKSAKLSSFVSEKMNPFESPFQVFVDLQVQILRTLQKLSEVELRSKISLTKSTRGTCGDFESCADLHRKVNLDVDQYLSKYSACIVGALRESRPLTVKLDGLDWTQSFCEFVNEINSDASSCYFCNKDYYICQARGKVSIRTILLRAVLDAAFDRELKVRSRVTVTLNHLLQASLISCVHFRAVAVVSLEKLADPCNSVKNGFLKVLSTILPLTCYTSGICYETSHIRGWHWRQLFALKKLPRHFKPQQLVSIFNYISQRWKGSLSNWMHRLVLSSQLNSKDFMSSQQDDTDKLRPDGLWMNVTIGPQILDTICSQNNLAAAWLSIQEAARYCIVARLRTHLGGPTQTFAAIERMLMDITHTLQVDIEQLDSSLISTSSTHLLPMRLLLDFVESLKKNVYNAYAGSFVFLPSTSQSSLFFRANKKVCEEWFARICEPMMNAGLALQNHSAALQYSALRLQDLQNTVVLALKDKNRAQAAESFRHHRAKTTEEVLKVLRYASLAMCRTHEPDALIGLQKWSTSTFSSYIQEDFQHVGGYTEIYGQFSWMTGLSYQAQGQYEKAAAHFTHLLQSEEALTSLGPEGVQFTIERIIESYAALSDWKSLESWLLQLQGLRAKHAGKNYSGALTAAGNELNAILALARFDEGDLHGSSSYLDLTPKSSTELTIDPKQALQRSEQMLLQAMLHKDVHMDKMVEEVKKAELMLDEVLSVAPLDGLSEAAAYATQLHCIYLFDEGHRFLQERDQPKPPSTMFSPLHQLLTLRTSQVHQDCKLWLKVFRVYRTVMPNSPTTLRLCLELISLARRQTNFSLAHRLKDYLMHILLSCPKSDFVDLLSNTLQYENILLIYAEDKHENAVESLWSFVHSYMLPPASTVNVDSCSRLRAKACLKLASWLKHDDLAVGWESLFLKIKADCVDSNLSNRSTNEDGPSITTKPSVSALDPCLLIEEISGMATKISTQLCPNMGKAWFSYASWCYSQGILALSLHPSVLQSVFLTNILTSEVPFDKFILTKEEIQKVEGIIAKLFCDKKSINANMVDEEVIVWSVPEVHLSDDSSARLLVDRAIYLIQAAASARGVEDSDGESVSSKLAAQLQLLFITVQPAKEHCSLSASITQLVDIFWTLRKRRVSMFGHAAKGFIQYLSLSNSKVAEGYSKDGVYFGSVTQKQESGILRSALYVLRILLNYGEEFSDIFKHGFPTVSAFPWQDIIPQLFARVSSHPQQVVRKQLEGLLLTLAEISPWSIIYPILVEINAYDGETSEELQHILGRLVQLHPKLVQDVKLVINELDAITILWEEQWLTTLQDLHTDVFRRINMLKEEVARVAENATLSHSEKSKINAAKYTALMAPIAVALDRRLESTSRKAETAHEEWFQNEYGEQLKSAISAFKLPPPSATALADVWRPFDSITASLAAHQRKNTITLSDVSPQLAQLAASDVPMPGLEKQVSLPESSGSLCPDLHGTVTISSFCEQVTILSTKTKPKKLGILGSDGKRYTYLLKGREDLRLDARIMQVLQAVDGLLHSCKETRRCSLFVRYYSVTPISGGAGLIQWVDNVTSIYSVYKSWQSRVLQAQVSGISGLPPVPRPSDMFYGKIMPALKEKGIRKVISRRDWPHEVKRKVLLDLMRETPKQLLHREIWCASEGFKAFDTKLKRYSGSMAAMSMVGHVLGLGDRHLDNILIDFSSGDIVHIDYNVCFDKGLRLKVPEIVPFRLTQTLEAALGLTGIEGVFRANCEAVVDILRKNKDVLLMLLEIFVWDPLVEWTRGDIHDDAVIGGEERKGMELAVSLSLFASRVQEIRVPLQEHHDLLLSTVPAAVSALEMLADALKQYEASSTLFYHADQERSKLLLHESSAKVIVAEATSNAENKRASFEVQVREFAQAKAAAIDKAQEAALWMEHHGRVLDALRNGSSPELHASIKFGPMEEALSLTSAVLKAGIPLTIVPEPTQVQCHDLDSEVTQVIADLDSGISNAVKSLQVYALTLQRILPLNYVTSSKLHGWAQILQLSVNNLSPEILTLARRQAADLCLPQIDKIDYVRQRYEALHCDIESTVNEIKRVQEERSELEGSVDLEIELKSKDRLLSVFSKYMQSIGHSRKEEDESFAASSQTKQHEMKDLKMVPQDMEDKKVKALSLLHLAAISLYKDVKSKVFDISTSISVGITWSSGPDALYSNSKLRTCELEEQIEKCVLIADTVTEIHKLSGLVSSGYIVHASRKDTTERNWAAIFQASVQASRNLIEQMTKSVLPEIAKSMISHNAAIMEIFGSLSQVRGSVDTAIEQLIETDLERASLMDLQQNYLIKVGLITEQKLALEDAAVKSRDHLSWEEAEELVSREEACRAQLDQLHQMWNQKDVHASLLTKKETTARNALVSAQERFLNVTTVEAGGELQHVRSKLLLSLLTKPFADLESVDQFLSIFNINAPHSKGVAVNISELLSSGCSLTETIWKASSLLGNHAFFIWKLCVVDSFLDACLHNVSSSLDHNLGFDQLCTLLQSKLESQLQMYLDCYLQERVAPILLVLLDREMDSLAYSIEEASTSNQIKKEDATVKRVQLMLEEYCNAHETARAARSAALFMKKHVYELTQNLQKASLELVQMEWLHDLSFSQRNSTVTHSYFPDDTLLPVILDVNRHKILESLQSSMSLISRSMDTLKSSDKAAVLAETQLERAMGWACAGPNSNSSINNPSKVSGIPPEFHNHLNMRRKLLQAVKEQADSILKTCSAVIEFEASRDGVFMQQVDSTGQTSSDGRAWQQTYLNALARLEVAHHSFSRSEQEWKLAESEMEAATSGLFAATSELHVFSAKADSASSDLHAALLTLRDCMREANDASSSFGYVARGQTALTTECGSMIEEVLAITDGILDLNDLGKQAAALHSGLMEHLTKVNMFLLPLESMLASDVAFMVDIVTDKRENSVKTPSSHAEKLYQNYCPRIEEACQSLKPIMSSFVYSVKELHVRLMTLAKSANFHAGILHKALEGLGGSQEVRSQGINVSGSNLSANEPLTTNKDFFHSDKMVGDPEEIRASGLSSPDEEWISPPDSMYSSSTQSSHTLTEATPSELNPLEATEQTSQGVQSETNGADSEPILLTEVVAGKSLSPVKDLSENRESTGQYSTCVSESGIPLEDNPTPTTLMAEDNQLSPVPDQIKGSNDVHNNLHDKRKALVDCPKDTPAGNLFSTDDFRSRVNKAKNAYALSVLRRVEMKLDGRGVDGDRKLSISDQVDCLLKQATSIDNLCNMYEGWTPWI